MLLVYRAVHAFLCSAEKIEATSFSFNASLKQLPGLLLLLDTHISLIINSSSRCTLFLILTDFARI